MSQRDALKQLAAVAEKTLDEFDAIEGQIRGVHSGVADMHREIMLALGGISERLLRLEESSRNERTAASAIPTILARLNALESEEEHAGANGNGTA